MSLSELHLCFLLYFLSFRLRLLSLRLSLLFLEYFFRTLLEDFLLRRLRLSSLEELVSEEVSESVLLSDEDSDSESGSEELSDSESE